jgi:hypothetical protein
MLILNVLGEKINSIKKNTESILDTSMRIFQEIHADKSRYFCSYFVQKDGEEHRNINTGNKHLENVPHLKYLGPKRLRAD